MKKSSRQKLLVAVRVIVSTALLAYLLSTVQLDELVAVWSDIVLPFVLLAIGLQLVGVVISALKWWLLLRASGHHVPYRWAVRAYFIGQFFNNFLPTMIGDRVKREIKKERRRRRRDEARAAGGAGFLALETYHQREAQR